jgi:hypothetical protein
MNATPKQYSVLKDKPTTGGLGGTHAFFLRKRLVQDFFNKQIHTNTNTNNPY